MALLKIDILKSTRNGRPCLLLMTLNEQQPLLLTIPIYSENDEQCPLLSQNDVQIPLKDQSSSSPLASDHHYNEDITPLNPSTTLLSIIRSKTKTPYIPPSPPPPPSQNEWNSFWESKTAVIGVVSLALFTDMVLYDCIVPILPELLKRSHTSESMMGILFAVYALGFLLATPLISIWSDRNKDRKKPMILGQIGLAISTLMFAYCGHSFASLVVARILQGVGAAVSWTLGLALLADSIPSSELGSAMGIVFGFNTLGYFVGPPLGGVFTHYFGIEAPFIICALLCVIDLICRSLIEPKIISTTASAPPSSIISPQETISVKKFICLEEVVIISITMILVNACFGAMETLLSIYLEKKFSLNVMQISFAMMAIIIPCIIGAFISGEQADRKCRIEMIFWGSLLYSVSLLFLGLSNNFPIFLLSCIMFGYSTSIVQAPALPEMACILNRLGGNNYAQIYGIINVSYSLGMLIGPLLISWMNSRMGISFNNCMIIFSCTLIPILIPVWRLAKKAKNGELESMKIRDARLNNQI